MAWIFVATPSFKIASFRNNSRNIFPYFHRKQLSGLEKTEVQVPEEFKLQEGSRMEKLRFLLRCNRTTIKYTSQKWLECVWNHIKTSSPLEIPMPMLIDLGICKRAKMWNRLSWRNEMPDANKIEAVRNVMFCRRCVLFSWIQLHCSHSNQTGTWTIAMCCFLEIAVGSGARLWVCLWLAKQRLSEILGRTKLIIRKPSHFSAQLQISKGWDPLGKLTYC